MTHDPRCNGTTTLFAAMSPLDGQITGEGMPWHWYQECRKSIPFIELEMPKG